MLAKNVEVSFDDSILRIKIKGDIDHHSAKRTREIIDLSIIDKKPLIIILDLSCVDFMDSSGIGVIMGRYKMAKILGGKVIIYGLKKQIYRIIQMSGIDKIIKLTPNLDKALRLLDK